MVKLIRREGYMTWEYYMTEIDLTDEQIQDIKKNFDGDVGEWANDNELYDLELVRDKITGEEVEWWIEDEEGNPIIGNP